MSEVVDHLAELTGYRDRDVMDVTLVNSLRDLLEPLSVAIYRVVGEAPEERWLTRARMDASDAVAKADPLWTELDQLPRLEEYAARLESLRSRSVIVVPGTPCITYFPLANDRHVVGVIEIHSVQALDMALRRMVSSVLRIYHNFQGLLDYSERDTLTGLLNRKTFDESFLKATMEMPGSADGRRQAGQAEARYWLGVIDIDHFKLVNDRFGHLIGDEVLLLLARLMRSSFRFHDQLYRFGGEEFVVLMRCDNGADAALAFERLRRNTEHYAFPQVGRITVSVGYSEVKPGDTPAAAFERADKAVYHSKENGRNQVFSHADLVAAGVFANESEKVGAMELF